MQAHTLHTPPLQQALDGLAALKAEHRPLVAQIARDPGMSPETRELLLSHLNEEEEERVSALQGLAGGAGEGGHPARLTVGSLRVESPGAVAAGVGSLRA